MAMEPNARLEEAIRGKNLRTLKDALRRGADPNLAVGDDGLTALAAAAATGHLELVQALLDAGAKPASDTAQTTCLHAAAEAGNLDMVRLLLESDAKPLLNRFDSLQRTPLICAVEAGHIDVARQLLLAGADVNARQDSGNTALRAAAGQGPLDMAKLLVAAGADPLIPGRLLLSPLDRARERNTPEGRLIAHLLTQTLESAAARAKRPASRRPPKKHRQKR